MRRIRRYARCPCGSGARFKRCCGASVDGDGMTRLERQDAVLEELIALPFLFPRLRPEDEDFGGWLDATVADAGAGEATVADAVARLPSAERTRIERAHARAFPAVWQAMCEELGSEELAAEAIVVGAVLAAVRERERPEPIALRLLEVRAPDDPAETLALLLDSGDLWGVHESAQLADGLEAGDEPAATAARLTTPWHERRLSRLVERLATQVPFPGFADASAAVASACDAFARDAAIGARVATMLLVDSLDRLERAQVGEPLRPAA